VLVALAGLTGSLLGLVLVYSVDLPQIAELERYRPSTTTDLYDARGRVFGSFALERRVVVNYDDFSPLLRQAVIAIEDKNFESHWGINVFRVGGAAWHDLVSSSRGQGASTLTMQLARNLFLSSQRTFARKLEEIYLSIQIERAFTKQQIFTLYANQIYLGHGMYGFEAGSEYYFSKHARDLTLSEAALLAGLPKGPAGYSPLLHPDRALRRRNLVIDNMLEDGDITAAQADAGRRAPLGLRIQPPQNAVAPWFVEEVRRELEKKLGAEQTHAAGLRVYTTLDLDLEQAATSAVLGGLAAYERRHGWRGHLPNVLAGGIPLDQFRHPDWAIATAPGRYEHALVTGVLPFQATARIGDREILLTPEDWKWTGFRTAGEFLSRGDIVYVRLTAEHFDDAILHAWLEQDSGAEGSLYAVDNTSGDVLAMVGGRDFFLSQFNRATQAERQTGSSFKPYVYAAAIEQGASPGDRILDSPVSFNGWSPHNYDNRYLGSITLSYALADSRNIPAVRLADRVGMHRVVEMAHRFGITSSIPPLLPVALGAAGVTLAQQVSAYSVFPNDGIRVAPRLIRKVTSPDGTVLLDEAPEVSQVIRAETARTMVGMLSEVTRSGTGAAAAALEHAVAGKTGTTNDFTDAWFLGFSPSLTCGVWVGYDNRQSLGDKETGARAALPIWMDFMKAALAGREEQFPAPLPVRSPSPSPAERPRRAPAAGN
jgi:penicillin-binding protein 1A